MKRGKTDKDKQDKPDNEHKKGHKVRNGILGVIGALILVPLLVFGIAYVVVDVPKPEELTVAQVSQIYASDGSTELARIVPPEGNRQMVDLDQIPVSVRDAVIAAEDREFYSNPGFSFTGYARAIKGLITGDSTAGGGSTITQQYVKNAVVGDDRTVTRKAKEFVYSAKMANEWSKDQVLEAYLNTVYFGRGAYGVQAAAQAYFGKDISELSVGEGALLATLIQQPSALDPQINRQASESRWGYVLDGMVETDAITSAERQTIKFPETLNPSENQSAEQTQGNNGLIRNRVMAELSDYGITETDVTLRGLQITTTIDSTVQNGVEEAVNEQLELQTDKVRAAVVSIEPSTGAVRGYYGGQDGNGWDFANAPLQTGSTFKIFGVAAALQQGIPLNRVYSAAPVRVGSSTVTNSGGNVCEVCSVSDALKYSQNTNFIRLQQDLENGSQDTADMAHALGVARSLPGIEKTLTENGQTPYDGVILGQYESRPVDMAVGLSTIANEGVWHKPHFVEQVKTQSGEVLYERGSDAGERRVSEQVAANLLQAMAPIASYSNGNALAGGRPSAAKTGTTQLGDTGQNKDAWMIGATPQLATAVWMGTADNTALTTKWGGNMYGANQPATIWKRSMDTALQDEDIERFPTATPINFGFPPPQTVVSPRPTMQRRPTTPSTSGPATTAPTSPETPESPEPAPSPTVPPPGIIPIPPLPGENPIPPPPGDIREIFRP